MSQYDEKEMNIYNKARDETERKWQHIVDFWKEKSEKCKEDMEDSLGGSESPPVFSSETLSIVSGKISEMVGNGMWRFRQMGQTAHKNVKSWSKKVFLHMGSIGAATIALLSTNYSAPSTVQFTLYIFAILTFCLLDPFYIFSRWLALQTRIVILLDGLIILALCAYAKFTVVTITMTLWILLSGFVCWAMNARWIIGNSWLYTEETTTIVRGLWKTADKAWQANGKRTCRTLLYELGYSKVDDDILDLFVLPVYELGHLHGLKKQYEEPLRELKFLQNDYDELSERYETLADDYDDITEELRIAKNKIAEIEQSKKVVTREEKDSKKVENGQQNNIENDIGLIVRNLRAKGMSYRKIAEELGISKYEVEKLVKSSNQNSLIA